MSSENIRDKSIDESELFDQLRSVLLAKEIKALTELTETIKDPKRFSEIVSPHIQENNKKVKEAFPDEYSALLSEAIEQRISMSQDEIIEILYPKFGKLIKKFIGYQMMIMKEDIDRQLDFKSRIKSMFGLKKEKTLLTTLYQNNIEQIFIVQHNSGRLLGSYQTGDDKDDDVIAAMLTAIKGFGEDALSSKSAIESIEYEDKFIFITNYPRYYYALILDGNLSSTEKDDISGRLLDFSDNHLKRYDLNSDESFERISYSLKKFFSKN